MKARPRRDEAPRTPPATVWVLVSPDVHLIDLSGPVQTLWEAASLGGAYEVRFVGESPAVSTAQGLGLAGIEPLPRVAARDLVLVPGTWSARLERLRVPRRWLRDAHAAGARLASICSGAFLLARAGLLDGRRCTTHWKMVERLRQEAPGAEILEDRLYVEDDRIWTSAGESAGIDLALALVAADHGPLVAARVAREMVVFLRRRGEDSQRSVYLDHRTHLHPGIHRVQDFLVANPGGRPRADELARLAGMSPRNLARVFRQATGTTPHQYALAVKLEVARALLDDPGRTIESIAATCGFEDARQLRRLWRLRHGAPISAARRPGAAESA